MSLEIFEEGVKLGSVHWGDHVSGAEPTNYLEINRLFVDAEEFIRALASLPHDRCATADLHHHRWCCQPTAEFKTSLIAGAIEWDPMGKLMVLRIGSIPFSRRNFLAFVRWLAAQQPWDRRFRPLRPDNETKERFRQLMALAERMAVATPEVSGT